MHARRHEVTSSIKTELLRLAEETARCLALPRIREIYMPEPAPAPHKDAEFGMVVLEDGSAGLYYAWLGDAQKGMQERFSVRQLTGRSAFELAEYYGSTEEDKCSLGLATINAVTRHVYQRCAYSPPSAGSSFGLTDITSADHVGMVGYFPSLVRRLRERQVRLTVIEKKPQFLSREAGVLVTLDPSRLSACNKILITAATLLNDTLDELIACTRSAESVTVLGPTAGFFPDPLFRRGVSAVGGTEIIDAVTALQRLRQNRSMGDTTRKFPITRDSYPGFRQLLDTAADTHST